MMDSSSLSRLQGMTVVGDDGRALGAIDGVYVSNDDDTGTFASVVGGGAAGGSFFPLHQAQLRDDAVLVPYSWEHVQSAPRVADPEEIAPAEERRLLEHYSLGGRTAAVATSTEDGMTLSEERLRVGTEQVETGRARLRKYVVTETQTRTVPVRREEVRVEREPIAAADAAGLAGSLELAEEEHEITLLGERPVVQKEVVPVERVRLETESVTEQVDVTDEVRKEQVEVYDPDEVREAPGAESGQPGGRKTLLDEFFIAPRD